MSDIPSDLAKDDVSVAASTSSSSSRGTQRRQQRGSINANHLLNFQSGPRDTRNTESATNRRRPASIRSSQRPAAYDRTKFLQANFRFIISDASEIQKYEADPDLMLNWDDIAAVDVVATSVIHCPITLSPPLCPCITPCGHIFSEEAIMAHMITQGGPELRISSACPICTTEVTARELRPVTIKQVGGSGSGNDSSGNDNSGSSIVSAGDRIKLRLLKRGKDSIIPHPAGGVEGQLKEESTAAEEIPCNIYAKFTAISDPMPLWSQRVKILAKKSVELIREGGLDANYEVPPILAAIEAMANRARVWTERRHRLLIEKLDDEDMAVALAGGALNAAEVAGKEAMAAVKRIAEVASREEEEMYKKSVAVHKLEEAFPALSVSSTMDKPTTMVEVPTPPTMSPPSTSIESLNLKNTTEERNNLPSSVLQQQQQPASLPAPAPVSLPSSEIYFYQSGDGQLIFLNPLNMKMYLESTGDSYTSLPHEIDALVLELEEIEQTEATRKRLKGCCGHLPLGLSFKLCEVDLKEILPAEALAPFEAELIQREKKRVQLAKLEARKTHREAIKAKSMAAAKAAAATGPTAAELAAMPLPGASTEPVAVPRASVEEFRGDEDEAGPSPTSSSSFPGGSSAGAGISFARMAKMGFAATGPALGEGLGSPPTPPWGSNAAVSGSSPGVASGVWGTTTTTNNDSSSISAQIDAALSLAASNTASSGTGGGKKKGRKITLLSTSHRR